MCDIKDSLVQGIVKMHDTLGHEKFNTVIKISMNIIDSKKKKGRQITLKDIKEILEEAVKISNVIHSK